MSPADPWPLIRGAVRALRPPPWWQEDALAEGALGYVVALRSFDPGRGVPFQLWAWRKIQGYVLHALRRGKLRDLAPPEEIGRRRRREPEPGFWDGVPPVLEAWARGALDREQAELAGCSSVTILRRRHQALAELARKWAA